MSGGRARAKKVSGAGRRVDADRAGRGGQDGRARILAPKYVPMSEDEEQKVIDMLAAILLDALRRRQGPRGGAEGGEYPEGSDQEERKGARG